MIGTDLNLVLPTLGDSYSDAIAKIAIALSSVEDSLGDKATPAVLNINEALNLQGNALTNISSLILAAGNLTNLAGSIFYYNGEFYAVDATGTVQLTANGALNATPGSITNLVSPAAVTWDSASQEFRFTTNNTPTYADLVCDDVVLKGATGSVRLDVHSAIATSRSMIVKSLPTTGCSFLVYKATDSTVEDSAVNTDAKTVAGDVTFAADIKHSSVRNLNVSLNPAASSTNVTLGVHGLTVASAGVWGWTGPSLALKAGDRITKIGVRISTASSQNITMRLYKTTDYGVATVIHTYTFNPGTIAGLYSQTVTVPETIGTDQFQFVELSGSTNGLNLSHVYIEHTRP